MEGNSRKYVAIGVGIVVLLWADWTFSAGPLTALAVHRCAGQLRHEVDGTSPGHMTDHGFQYDNYTAQKATEACKDIKRQGRLTLSGGVKPA